MFLVHLNISAHVQNKNSLFSNKNYVYPILNPSLLNLSFQSVLAQFLLLLHSCSQLSFSSQSLLFSLLSQSILAQFLLLLHSCSQLSFSSQSLLVQFTFSINPCSVSPLDTSMLYTYFYTSMLTPRNPGRIITGATVSPLSILPPFLFPICHCLVTLLKSS